MDLTPVQLANHVANIRDSLANRNVLVVGGPGYAKSTKEAEDLADEADRGDTAIVCVDPHEESLGMMLFARLCERGHRDRTIYDRLPLIEPAVKWELLTPSRARSARERYSENQTRCEQFAEILLRRRGKDSAATTPGIEDWLLAALNLYIYQRMRRPLADLRYAFRFDHPKFQEMLDGCADDDTRFKFQEIIGSHHQPYKAAERVIMGVCRSAAFQARTEHCGGFDFEGHLGRKGIVIVEGPVCGTLSADAMGTMMGAIILKSINYVREHHGRVTLALDEASNASLIGVAGHEVRAMAELRKRGLGVHVILQLLNLPSPAIERAVMGTCATHRYYNCSDLRTVARAAEDLGGTYQTTGTKRRYYKDGSIWDAPAIIDNPYADDIRGLGCGECITRYGNRIVREKFAQPPNPFGLSKTALPQIVKGLLKAVQQRPEYYTPGDGDTRSAQSPLPAATAEVSDGPFSI